MRTWFWNRVRAHLVHRYEQGQGLGKVLLIAAGVEDKGTQPVQPPGRVGDLEVCGRVRDRLKQSR